MTEITYEKQYEPIVISKPLIDLLLKQEKASDLIALYTFYYYTGKWQKTNRTKATSSYVQKGLNWSSPRFSYAKRKLKELGLIEDYQSRDKDTKFITGHYIKVNFMWRKEKVSELTITDPISNTNSIKPRRRRKLPTMKSYPLGNMPPNALSDNNLNTLSDNKELYIDFLKKWNSCQIIIHKKLTGTIKTRIKYILKDYTKQEVFKAMENYSLIIKSNDYYFNHKWTLKDFLKRGIEKFLDEADPLNNFKDNKNQQSGKIPLEDIVNKFMKNPIWPKNYEFDKYRLGKGLVELKKFSDNLIRDRYNRSHEFFGTLAKLLKEYVVWIDENDWITDMNENIIGTGNKVFKQFIEFQENEIGIKIKSKGWK